MYQLGMKIIYIIIVITAGYITDYWLITIIDSMSLYKWVSTLAFIIMAKLYVHIYVDISK